jgi:hypothetical protein
MTPGQLCNGLLHNWPLRLRLRESPHIFEVAGRKPLMSGNFEMEILASWSMTQVPRHCDLQASNPPGRVAERSRVLRALRLRS